MPFWGIRECVLNGYFDGVESILETGLCNVNDTSYETLGTLAHMACVRGALCRGVCKILKVDGQGRVASPDGFFLDVDQTCILELLMNYGADINCKNRLKQTPLMIAAHHGSLNIARFLIRSGVEWWARDHEGKTVLDHAYNDYAREEIQKVINEQSFKYFEDVCGDYLPYIVLEKIKEF